MRVEAEDMEEDAQLLEYSDIDTRLMGLRKAYDVVHQDTKITSYVPGSAEHVDIGDGYIRLAGDFDVLYTGINQRILYDRIITFQDILSMSVTFSPQHNTYWFRIFTVSSTIPHEYFFNDVEEARHLMHNIQKCKSTQRCT